MRPERPAGAARQTEAEAGDSLDSQAGAETFGCTGSDARHTRACGTQRPCVGDRDAAQHARTIDTRAFDHTLALALRGI
jgi:hypothetical protein